MNFLRLLMLSLLTFTLVACSDSDGYSNSDLVGSWEWVSTSADDIETNSEARGLDSSIREFVYDYYKDGSEAMTFVFNKDGTFIRYSSHGTSSGTYHVKNDKLTTMMNGKSEVVKISITSNTLAVYTDNTEYYQDLSTVLLPGVEGVEVDKVIEKLSYKRVE